MTKPAKVTPMLRQYMEIKEQYEDTILFFRMGDFYEMFFEDAVTASRVLGITLTSRSSKSDENKIPMCGVPFHAVSGYLTKMVKAGFRVAICEQVEDPREAKGVVKREVVRVVTPGLVTEEQLLDDKTNRYLAAVSVPRISKKNKEFGISLLDITTGEFLVTERVEIGEVIDELTRMSPSEILLEIGKPEEKNIIAESLEQFLPDVCLTYRPSHTFQLDTARETLLDHFQTVNLAGFGCEDMPYGISAAGALLDYILETQKTDISHVERLVPIDLANVLLIDDSSRRNLEIAQTIVGGKREGSLLHTLDYTCTPMGARLLRRRLLFPLRDVDSINARLMTVEQLFRDASLRENLRDTLSRVYDLERLNSRVVLGRANARDLTAVKYSFAQLPEIKNMLKMFEEGLLKEISDEIDDLSDLRQLIDYGIREDAVVSLREGNIIKEGFNEELDELIAVLRDGKQMILSHEAKERERTGIAKLKIGFNKVFGYYLEVSKGQLANVPDYFIRKQTLVNAERYITPELKEFENKVMGAQDKRLELEYKLFSEIRDKVAEKSAAIIHAAAQIARLDVFTSLAEVARRNRYVSPLVNEGDEITIIEGRHPVIEKSLPPGKFVPNDVHLDQHSEEVLIITGPNMAGKSTILRQTALIVLMAQMGSFVPAEEAEIGVVDRIFTRVGAMDDLRKGQSTFMVEMNETANILNNATEKSLVILDEIGRGTSTFDGLSIAWAVAEDLVEKNGKGVKTLFATHYHELTELSLTHKRVKNYNIAVREWNDAIIFLHKLMKGGTNRSYGIQVASLAGVPSKVVDRAGEILRNIEKGELNPQGEPRIASDGKRYSDDMKKAEEQPSQLSLFGGYEDPVREKINSLQLENLTPLEALNLLFELKNMNK